MDLVIPASVDPTIRLIINILVGVHIFAFLAYVYLLLRSSNRTQADEFRDQYKNMETKAKQKQAQGK
jgi:cbb3-type cytochrome oxidase subunit 3